MFPILNGNGLAVPHVQLLLTTFGVAGLRLLAQTRRAGYAATNDVLPLLLAVETLDHAQAQDLQLPSTMLPESRIGGLAILALGVFLLSFVAHGLRRPLASTHSTLPTPSSTPISSANPARTTPENRCLRTHDPDTEPRMDPIPYSGIHSLRRMSWLLLALLALSLFCYMYRASYGEWLHSLLCDILVDIFTAAFGVFAEHNLARFTSNLDLLTQAVQTSVRDVTSAATLLVDSRFETLSSMTLNTSVRSSTHHRFRLPNSPFMKNDNVAIKFAIPVLTRVTRLIARAIAFVPGSKTPAVDVIQVFVTKTEVVERDDSQTIPEEELDVVVYLRDQDKYRVEAPLPLPGFDSWPCIATTERIDDALMDSIRTGCQDDSVRLKFGDIFGGKDWNLGLMRDYEHPVWVFGSPTGVTVEIEEDEVVLFQDGTAAARAMDVEWSDFVDGLEGKSMSEPSLSVSATLLFFLQAIDAHFQPFIPRRFQSTV